MDNGNRPLSDVEFVAFDLETTGLSPVAHRIVEVGAVRFRLDGQQMGCMEQLVDPEGPIPPEVTKIHGITETMVRGKSPVGDVLPRFLEFLGGTDTILLAHNATFDLDFLTVAAAKLGVPLPAQSVVDTLELARTCLRGLTSYRLESVALRLGVAAREDHRSLSDSRLVAGVFQKIVGRNPRLQTVSDLFHLSPPVDFQGVGTMAGEPPEGYEEFVLAIEEGRTIIIAYEGGSKGAVERRVTPRALLHAGGRPYLTAYCHIDCIEKTFRLDRIRAFRVEEH